MISGIGGFNSVYSYQAQYNQYRLNQIMQNRPGSSGSSVESVPSVNKANSSLKEGVAYIKSYSTAMADLMSSANSLRSGNQSSVVNQLSASSSDAAVLDAASRFRPSGETSYDVNVAQLAAAQTNVSSGLDSVGAASSDLSMQIAGTGGAKDIQIRAVNEDGSRKTNHQVLTEAAAAVNSGGTGVQASVIVENGKSSLKLQAQKTGKDNGFQVTGSFADDSGMNQVQQAGQDAQYSVTQNGKTQSYTSDSNKVSLDFGRIEATLKKEGAAKVNVGMDTAKTVSSMEDFVKSYNSAVALLSKNTDKGAGTARQLQSLQGFVPGSKEGMDHMGLSMNKDGTLSLDKTKLSENLKKEPELTRELISGSSGLAQRAFSTSQKSANVSVSSLIGNSLASASYASASDPINMMSAYGRSGAYNLMNMYATGMLFNSFG